MSLSRRPPPQVGAGDLSFCHSGNTYGAPTPAPPVLGTGVPERGLSLLVLSGAQDSLPVEVQPLPGAPGTETTLCWLSPVPEEGGRHAARQSPAAAQGFFQILPEASLPSAWTQSLFPSFCPLSPPS